MNYLFVINRIMNIKNIISNPYIFRFQIKIQREQSLIANKKIKNVKYNKMSNKKVIIKSIIKYV